MNQHREYITSGGYNAKRDVLVISRTMRSLLSALALSLVLSVVPVHADDLIPDYWERTPLPQTGLATFYASGLMEYVDGYRRGLNQLPDCPECVGSVALLRAGDIGRKVWLQLPDSEPIGPFLVIDCARRQDVAPLLARNWAVDVSYELGQLWGMTRPLEGVTVLEDPADASPARASGMPTPFFVPPGQAVISAPTATPAHAAPVPTPWPTRLPGPRFQPFATERAAAVAPAATAAPRMPPPLTPIITTPTPQTTPSSAAGSLPPVGAPTATPQPTETAIPDAAVGRPGAALLGAAPALVTPQTQPAWPTRTVTPRPPTRTPRPDLTPILPSNAPATPAPDDAPLIRFWRSILSFILQ